MANGVQGDIKLGVGLETKSAKQALISLKKSLLGCFGGTDVKGLQKQIKDTNREIRQQERNVAKLKQKLDELNATSHPPKSVSAMSKELQNLEKDLKKADAEFEKLAAERSEFESRQVDGFSMEQSLDSEQYARFQELDNMIIQNGQHTAELQASISKLKDKISKLKANPNLTDEGKKYNAELKKATAELENQKRKLAELENEQVKTSNTTRNASSSVMNFGKRISSLAKSALVFSVITKSLTMLRQAFGRALVSNDEFANSLAQIKGNLLTAFMPIYQIILPALNVLMSIFAKITAYIAQFVAMITGKSVDASRKAAKSLYEQAKAADAAGGAAKNAAKDAEKSALSFDQLNTLSTSKDDSSGSGGTSSGGSAPDFSSSAFDTSSIEETLKGLEAFIGGALAAVGVILLFTGHPIIGVGLIAAGLIFMAMSAKEGFKDNEIKQTLTDLCVFLGTMALVFGVVFLFYGLIPLGLGLLAVGAIAIATAIAANWGEPKEIRETLNNLLTYISSITLVLGAILVISGVNIPLGITLLAIGAVALASIIALNWEAISGFITKHIDAIRVILGGALLVVGAILAISGVNLPLGIGLLAIGAIALGNAAVLAWDKLSQETKTKIAAITAIVSGAVLAVGILLALTGVNLPLGIALIAAGAVGLVAAAALSWDTLKKKVKEFLNGIIELFEKGVNKIIGLLNKISFDLPDALGGAHIGFNIQPISIPRLAQGAVIPANREFLAVLGDQKHGTNIEAPADLIKQMVNEALEERGYSDNQTININFTGNLAQLARVLKPQLDKEATRKGVKLVKGGAY